MTDKEPPRTQTEREERLALLLTGLTERLDRAEQSSSAQTGWVYDVLPSQIGAMVEQARRTGYNHTQRYPHAHIQYPWDPRYHLALNIEWQPDRIELTLNDHLGMPLWSRALMFWRPGEQPFIPTYQ